MKCKVSVLPRMLTLIACAGLAALSVAPLGDEVHIVQVSIASAHIGNSKILAFPPFPHFPCQEVTGPRTSNRPLHRILPLTAPHEVHDACDYAIDTVTPSRAEEVRLAQLRIHWPRCWYTPLCKCAAPLVPGANVGAFSSALDAQHCLAGDEKFSGCCDNIFIDNVACAASTRSYPSWNSTSNVTFGDGVLGVQRVYWYDWKPPPIPVVRARYVATDAARLMGVYDNAVSLRAVHGHPYRDTLVREAVEREDVIRACRNRILRPHEGALCALPIVSHVIAAKRSWGSAIFHFHTEVLPMVLYLLDRLEATTDVKRIAPIHVHMSGISQYAKRWLHMLQWDDVAVMNDAEVLFAENAYFMDLPAAAPLASAHLLEYMKERVLKRTQELGHPVGPASPGAPRTILMLERRDGGAHNTRGSDSLDWDEVDAALAPTVNSSDWRMLHFQDSDASLIECIPCQVSAFAQADVIVGFVGAGMSNLVYTRQGTRVLLLVEPDNGLHGLPPFVEFAMLQEAVVVVRQVAAAATVAGWVGEMLSQ